VNNFDLWNKQKQEINSSSKNKFVNEGDVWWCVLGMNIGYEQNGKHKNFKRPVLIIKKFSNNVSLVIPLTTSSKDHRFRYLLNNTKIKKSKIIISQMKTIDNKRLNQKITRLDKLEINKIRKTIRKLF
jgi:mRNA interferase MazF